MKENTAIGLLAAISIAVFAAAYSAGYAIGASNRRDDAVKNKVAYYVHEAKQSRGVYTLRVRKDHKELLNTVEKEQK